MYEKRTPSVPLTYICVCRAYDHTLAYDDAIRCIVTALSLVQNQATFDIVQFIRTNISHTSLRLLTSMEYSLN